MPTWNNTTLCTKTDVEAYFRDLSFLLATETGDSTLDSQVTAKIALVKRDVIRPEVQLLAQQAFPNTVDNLKRLARTRYRQYLQHINADKDLAGIDSLVGNAIDVATYESWFTDYNTGIKPRVWHSSGTPDSTTNTSAVNGDFCIDNTNELMYINRSETSTPDWDQWTAESAHDYIYDASVLKQWAIFETALLCLNDRAFRNFLTTDKDLLELKDMLYEQIHGTKGGGIKQRALKLLRFDISGDGAISDYENGATGEVFLGFA